MKRIIMIAAIASGVVLAGQASASKELATKYNCLACHAVDKKLVGPAYKEVAAKYKGQADAQSKLAGSVKNGSSKIWGPVPMPPNAAVPDADIAALVKWVLAQ